ncbi:MAG TPA: Ppx/GppA phosphatase family protein [Caulobacteraceae bacterium]|jgi:exopolyphosphatase/guanosine-5'-triphosphate,3'-diphosphate pyrophosphatase|nr:Ppx/GppA phosphatase family protein [Caulobacteraceae bacterium]
MSQAPIERRGAFADADRVERARCYGALDLGTNNCRLLIATPARGGGFRIVEAFSRIVRLGEGLSRTGELQPEAMERAIAALRVCADKVRRRQVVRLRAVATQACRSASNGQAFVDRVERETGLKLTVITPDEEARLSVAGCANLLDPSAEAALVVDVGGGSTELSWVAIDGENPERVRTDVKAWLSIPIGVVTLAERFPEPDADKDPWFAEMVAAVSAEISAFNRAEGMRPVFDAGRAHMVGTSGAITSLAGLHLGLPKYERARVDGLWMNAAQCRAAARRLIDVDAAARAAEPCIGKDRADLVLAGAAILQAVQDNWPCERVRVADRGLREGMLISLMKNRRRRRRRGR